MSASPQPEGSLNQNPAPGAETQQGLYKDIFGGDDDSDLSSEDEGPRRTAQRVPQTIQEREDEDEDEDFGNRRAAGSVAPPESDDEEDDEAGDVYVPGDATRPAKIPKFKKKKRREEDDEDGDDDMMGEGGRGSGEDGEEPRRKKKKKRRERREHRDPENEEDAAPVYDEETQRRMALEERIDRIGKKEKVTRRKKKGEDVDIVDSHYDDLCMRLRERMMQAAEKDKQSNEAKMPATAKLALLDEVMGVLRTTVLWQSILDNGVLEAVRAWLEPIYPSGALPAVGIQKAIFEILPKMDLDTTTLKESRLGPIVLFYTKTPRVTPQISRAAEGLVQAWSRPIIKRPNNYRSMHVETQGEMEDRVELMGIGNGGNNGAEGNGDGLGGGESTPIGGKSSKSKSGGKRFDIQAALLENKGRKGARMPVVQEIQYTVAPQSRAHHDADDRLHVARIQQDNSKFNKFARQIKSSRR